MKKIKEDLTIFQMEQASIQFKKTHTVPVSSLTDSGEPQLTLHSLNKKVDSNFAYLNNKIDSNFAYLNKRIDNLINEPPKWFKDFAKLVIQRFDKLEARIDNLEARIDNLVSKNNLKE